MQSCRHAIKNVLTQHSLVVATPCAARRFQAPRGAAVVWIR